MLNTVTLTNFIYFLVSDLKIMKSVTSFFLINSCKPRFAVGTNSSLRASYDNLYSRSGQKLSPKQCYLYSKSDMCKSELSYISYLTFVNMYLFGGILNKCICTERNRPFFQSFWIFQLLLQY